MGKMDEIGDVVEKVGDAFDKNITSKEEKLLAYNKGMEDARNMHREAINQGDKFTKRGIYYLAFFWSTVASVYLFCVTFIALPVANQRIADTILGFLLGTIVSAIINFFFGSSYSSQQKQKQSDGMLKRLFNKDK